LEEYVRDGGQTFWLNQRHHLPGIGSTNAPVFITRTAHRRFDALQSREGGRTLTWYEDWAERCFQPVNPMVRSVLWDLYSCVLEVLLEARLLEERQARGEPVWGIPPAVLRVTREVLQFRCGRCGHTTSGPAAE